MPALAVELLAAAPPSVARKWGHAHGLDLEGSHGAAGEPLEPRALDPVPWASPQLIDMVAAAGEGQAASGAEALIASGEVLDSAPVGTGVNDATWVELSSGVQGYHKAFASLDVRFVKAFGHSTALQPIHEVAAWQFARALGDPWRQMLAPCVLRIVGRQLGSFALHVDGDPGIPWGGFPDSVADAAAFLDSLIGQQDRHSGNWLYDPDSRGLHLIDHGFAFATPGDRINASYFVASRATRDRTLQDHELEALERVATSTDLLGVARLLEPERARSVALRAARMLATGKILGRGEF